MSFLAPGWLAGLALLPVLWWLHRLTSRGRSVYVSSLLLWADPRPAGAQRATAQRRADLVFLRRALALACLSLGLAAPDLALERAPLVVWVDGAASLDAIEHGERRIDAGLRELARRASARGGGDVTIRSLSDPSFSVSAGPSFAALAGRLPRGVPHLPEPARLDPAAEHWVLTDGATADVNAWIERAPLSQIIAVGESTENVGVTVLAVRPALGRAALDVEIRVRNAGHGRAERSVRLESRGARLWSESLRLEPDSTLTLRTTVGMTALPLSAQLTPADALTDDDRLDLATSEPLIVPVTVDARCSQPLRAAIAAHPRLVAASASIPAQLSVECSETPDPTAPARLQIHRVGVPMAIAAGDQALVVRRGGPDRRVDTALDLDDPVIAASDEYPLLVAALVDAALGRALLEEIPAAHRAREAINVAPLARFPEHPASAPRVAATRRELGAYPLALALLLIALDATFALRSLVRGIRYYRGAQQP